MNRKKCGDILKICDGLGLFEPTADKADTNAVKMKSAVMLDAAVKSLMPLALEYASDETDADYESPLTFGSDFPLPDRFSAAAAVLAAYYMTGDAEKKEIFDGELERIKSEIPASVGKIVEKHII